MSIHVAVNHRTRYKYDRSINLSPHVFRLRPAVHSRTPVKAYSLIIRPETHFINWQQDPFGNFCARVVFPEKTKELYVEVDLVAEMTVINPFDFFVEEYADNFPWEYPDQLKKELGPYLEIRDRGPLLTDWLSSVEKSDKNTVTFLVELNQRLYNDINYTIRMEPGVQTCEQTLGKASGSCRDSGWLLVQILRHLGFAARFVSGYLIQLTADVKSLDGPSGPEADFTDLHAWAEVYVPGAGWIGLDPTSGLFAGEGHIPLACTPDYVSAAPVSGFTDKCETEFSFNNTVTRIHEDPRVTKPYTDGQWKRIIDLGQQVEKELIDGDVRLSMGGEPTFVSIDDMESAQWNTAALGKDKRRLAGNLLVRLRETFAKGGMLHYGQGKWYPGEPLPRWSLSCFWRKDGVPMWKDIDLLADETRDYGHTVEDARQFTETLCRRLGLHKDYIVPGYEDIFYILYAEGKLPINVDPLSFDLKDSGERKRLAKILSGDPGKPAGFALPIAWDFEKESWKSSVWEFRRGRMYLTPGDSPMGLRLPLESLPWKAKEKERPMPERTQFEEYPRLGDYHDAAARRTESSGPVLQAPETVAEDETEEKEKYENIAHTALCIESRDGRIHIFLPPVSYLEHYLEILAAVELTCGELSMPVVLEGYTPPEDPRIQNLKVTPDPGVIEVNIHPSESWNELVETIETLYEEARLSRLGTEKFMLDGRHTGTGGGNHVTIGGLKPADSPILRRPDLLRSMITYWQHHPGLSYLFSGMFIGPTSQSPRVDEGRTEQLYELEIAFQQLDREKSPPYWLVDRALRHLLVDITGNTHRAEFCIDKLYSPDSLSGQLGLVEFRAFDMPPHARMSIVQMLLIRTLIARFWKKPYRHPLVRWGTELHDRWLLPHYVWEDMREVTDDLRREGYDFDLNWFAPFFEFRFPHYGAINIRDVEIELRMAIEPWHVLGEEVTRAGTSRFVDSSVERLQVKAKGLTDRRYVITCNGRPLSLNNTGTHGEFVCGVRYRAWQPPSALHPTIGVHSPLVIDLMDRWTGRSLGGCTYHVMHPGGRSYDVFPVNAYEAEARRVTRFWAYGHTPQQQPAADIPPDASSYGRFETTGSPVGPAEMPRFEHNPEYPHTLDLRFDPEEK